MTTSIRDQIRKVAEVPVVLPSDSRHISISRRNVRNPAVKESHRQLEAKKLAAKINKAKDK